MEAGTLVAEALVTGAEGSEILCRKSTKRNSVRQSGTDGTPPTLISLGGGMFVCVWDTFKPIQNTSLENALT